MKPVKAKYKIWKRKKQTKPHNSHDVTKSQTTKLWTNFEILKFSLNNRPHNTRLWGINTEFVEFIAKSLVLRSIVWDWILTYRNWSIDPTEILLSWFIRAAENYYSCNFSLWMGFWLGNRLRLNFYAFAWRLFYMTASWEL